MKNYTYINVKTYNIYIFVNIFNIYKILRITNSLKPEHLFIFKSRKYCFKVDCHPKFLAFNIITMKITPEDIKYIVIIQYHLHIIFDLNYILAQLSKQEII